MGIMSSEWRGRLGHWMRTLKDDFYRPLGEISWEAFCTMEHLSREEAMAGPFQPVEPGFTWGHTWEYCWFKGRVVLPKEAQGKRIVMDLKPDGESTLFVNGKEFGTYRASWVTQPHHFVEDNVLTTDGQEGQSYEILMETYAGHYYPEAPDGGCATGPVLPGSYTDPLTEGKRRTLGVCTFGIWNEDAYQLWMDADTLQQVLGMLDENSLRAAKIAEALERFTLAVDFEQDEAGRIASYKAGREALGPALEAKNGSTMPVFYAVGNAHIDLAWLWPMAETHRKTERTFAAQLRLLEEYPEYKYIQSQPAAYEMCRKYYPELFARIKEAVKQGRWIAEGAMWVEPDTNMASGEALIRQLLYGKRYYKEEFGVDSQMLWLPDTFGYTAALPQILKSCGVKYLVTQKIFWSYNEGEQFPYHYFYWEGMDGSKIVSFLPTSYTYRTDPTELMKVWENRSQKRDLDAFLLPFGYGDGGGGPARDYLEYAEREKDLEGCPRVKLEGPVEFFEDMEKEGGPKHTYTGELYFSAHRGTYTSQAMVKQNNRRCELAMRELELWGSLAARRGQEYPAGATERLWKEVLLHQFHDILPGSSIARVYEEAERAFHAILEESAMLTDTALSALVEKGDGVTVGNSLGFGYETLVELPESFAAGAQTREGQAVPVEKSGDKVFGLVKLPAYGMVSLVPAKEAAKAQAPVSLTETAEGFVLENSLVRAVVNDRGEVVSFVLKESGREFAAEPMNRFHLYKDVPRLFDAWDIDSNYIDQEIEAARDVKVTAAHQGGLRAALKVTGRISNSSFTQYIRLDADSRRLEFETEIDWRELHRLLKVGFPVNVFAENGINEMQFGYVERPTRRSRAYDKDRFEVCNHRYSALCDQAHGAAVLNDCKYGISMNENALELTLLRAAAAPEMRADNRVHRFAYGFTAWEGSFADCDVVRQGYEMNVKPVVVSGVTDAFSAFAVEKDNVILESVKPAEDGSGDLILRLYESKKAAVSTKLSTSLGDVQVWSCDMLENRQVELPAQGGETELSFRAFEIRTLRMRIK
ncbi:MAG: glycoside hydrolase family 38 C-terminal domain-containing protein [Eubacteriales bacterium]|nr:glycoside hydrolase family 38 C-terminal domain-containing protein [Eubacteriales bacterium]